MRTSNKSQQKEAPPALGVAIVRPRFSFRHMARPSIVASVKTGGRVTNRERVRFPYVSPFSISSNVQGLPRRDSDVGSSA